MSDPDRLVWRKSSYSNSGSGSDCVEVAHTAIDIALRDSKNPTGGVLVLPAAAWSAFRAQH